MSALPAADLACFDADFELSVFAAFDAAALPVTFLLPVRWGAPSLARTLRSRADGPAESGRRSSFRMNDVTQNVDDDADPSQRPASDLQ